MKAKLLQPAEVANPLWSAEDFDAATKAGQPYTVAQFMTVKAGYLLSDPLAWCHCCPGELNAAPIAVAEDDECRAAVKKFMEETRPAALEQLRTALESIDSIADEGVRKELLARGRAYGLLKAAKTSTAN